MKTRFNNEEFLQLIADTLRPMLERDFRGKDAHIQDLMVHTTTTLDSVYYFVDACQKESK
jgi:hypothetical protein